MMEPRKLNAQRGPRVKVSSSCLAWFYLPKNRAGHFLFRADERGTRRWTRRAA